MPNHQSRVKHGFNAQQTAQDFLTQSFSNCTIEFVAHPGSNQPDIIATVDGHRLQFEVKSNTTPKSPIATINSIIRRDNITAIDNLIPLFTDNRYADVVSYVEAERQQNDHIGFPDQDGTPRAGKLPKHLCLVDDTDSVHQALRDHFSFRNDDYLCIVSRRPSPKVFLYHTGHGSNPLNAPTIPTIRRASLKTYGTADVHSMRVALYTSFDH